MKLIAKFGPFNISYTGSGGNGPTGTVSQYWKLYLVESSPRVYALAHQPVVMQGLNNSSQPKYLHVMTNWYDDPSAWDVYLAASGPSNWARVPYGTTNVPVKTERATKVTDVVEHNASISFNVSRTGVPVVVAISYFPNWHVSGAEGRLPGEPEPHGGGAHLPPRQPDLRLHPRRLRGLGPDSAWLDRAVHADQTACGPGSRGAPAGARPEGGLGAGRSGGYRDGEGGLGTCAGPGEARATLAGPVGLAARTTP